MKVAIIEPDHFQYGLTQSELFEGHEKLFFVSPAIRQEMQAYDPDLCDGKFYEISDLKKEVDTIISICNEQQVDLLLFSPIFDSFDAVLRIAKEIRCTKILTIHNVNFWFNPRSRTLRSLKDKWLKKQIVRQFDYIAVEDFIYAYLKEHNKKLFDAYKFVYIPFTIFQEKKSRKYEKERPELKVVLPGSIHKERRRYENVLEVIRRFAEQETAGITFSFAGAAYEDYGKWVVGQLEELNKLKPGIVSWFDLHAEIHPDMFLREMETADLVLSTSTHEFKALGTTEYIGKTKPTAAIHDMMSFQLPGLLPSHLKVPVKLQGSVFNYEGAEELKNMLQQLLDNPGLLAEWTEQAKKNSFHFTAAEIRKQLPFMDR